MFERHGWKKKQQKKIRSKDVHDVWALAVRKVTEPMEHEIGHDNLSKIMDSGTEEHVITRWDCHRLGEVVRGKCAEQAVEMTVLVADRATKSLCSATGPLTAGYGIDLRLTQSVHFHKQGGSHTTSEVWQARLP